MPAGDNWSPEEVRLTVQDYMTMLTLELARQHYNKSEHRRALLSRLSGRSDGAVELKHQNISSILDEMGCFWIPGYKPRRNYQGLLQEEVLAWIDTHPEFDRQALAAAEAPAATPPHADFSGFEVEKPIIKRSEGLAEAPSHYGQPNHRAVRRDYLAREARNASLGRAGELLTLRYEQERLSRAGHEQLANKVEHIAAKDDGAGFDILSFETTGCERYIEVKTTAFAKETPFFASEKEVSFASQYSDRFRLFRLFDFKNVPRCFVLPGSLHDHCVLNPATYRCSFG